MTDCGEAVRRPHRKPFYHLPACQSPALKIQGKLNNRPGKVRGEGCGGQQEAGIWGQGQRILSVSSPDDPLLRAWLPRREQGGLGRHCRHLRLGPRGLRKGGSRLVSADCQGEAGGCLWTWGMPGQ